MIMKQVENKTELQQAFSVREQVFIIEQQVPAEIELDAWDHDPATVHLLALADDGRPIGTARFRPYTVAGVCKVERVAVLAAMRGTGLGRRIMQAVHEWAQQHGYHTAKLHAQLHAKDFYIQLGYDVEGDLFVEADIEHVAMVKRLAAANVATSMVHYDT